jgi:hypothetical protein
VAAGVWLLSVGGEAWPTASWPASAPNPANKGRTCRDGLWRYSRHPNYFFEWLHWFTYVLLAVGSPLWWLAWAGPLLMYVFLRYLSGIPFTEKQALRSRGDDYRAYQRSTPMFFPGSPVLPRSIPHERDPVTEPGRRSGNRADRLGRTRLVPDAALRAGIRACARSACTRKPRRHRGQSARFSRRIAELADSPLALHTDAANRQHYEVRPPSSRPAWASA